jgi:tetratricopeptide (TPR) repeat protein
MSGIPVDIAAPAPHTSSMGPQRGLNPIISQLRDHLAFRRMESGMQALAVHSPALDSLDPAEPNAGVLLGLIAQWVDAGFASPALVRELLTRFPASRRAELPLLDYLHLRLAEGMIAMAGEDFPRATQHFRFVQSLEGEINDCELLAISNFWTARCLRHMGRYDDALVVAVKGRRLALDSGYTPMAAIVQVLESWLSFQKGKLNEAVRLLQEAEAALSATDDYVTRGNIQSAYGRIARRQGRHEAALDYFHRAIAEYQRRDPQHLHLARSLVNIAVVERLIALRRQKEIDQESARRRADSFEKSGDASRAGRAEIERLRADARTQLASALAIYTSHGQHRGIGTVFINSGLLYLEGGDLESAGADAGRAFSQGEDRRDYILLARARLLQCAIENTRLEEQIGEDPAHHAQLAATFARDAVEYATQTQNPRLLARAHVWQGLTLAAEPSADLEAARRCCQQAMALVQPEGSERMSGWDELDILKARVLHARPIDPLLRAWSNGAVENRTFQQMTEEFARIVIPKVWEREDRKVARVAKKLSISPKKVRRILQSAGVSEGRHV